MEQHGKPQKSFNIIVFGDAAVVLACSMLPSRFTALFFYITNVIEN